MSYLRKAKATCGRHAEKPNQKEDSSHYEDETSIPVQDQIDNLRAKISLKEKYNKALREEVSETNDGAATMLVELVQQTKQLQEDLQFELNAEKYAVKKALRSYRLFQLAVSEKNAECVINWLDDKIFDASKALNEGIYLLKKMQIKIQDAEGQVRYLEHCPVPGSEQWERKAEDDRVNLECAIEAKKANRDAVIILNKRYRDILYSLRGEKGKWPHTMASMERTLSQLQHELSSLELMLEDANRFRVEAHDKLNLTEEEASANRKQRRSQMNKMKKSVERALEANTAKYQTHDAPPEMRARVASEQPSITQSSITQKSHAEVKAKQLQVQEYEEIVHKLVEAMRVSDLRQCPKRLRTVHRVNEVLRDEVSMKEEMRDLLIKHKYRLELIRQYFSYTGNRALQEYKENLEDKQSELDEVEATIRARQNETNEDGTILSDLRYSLIGLDEVLHQGKKKPAPLPKNQNLRAIFQKQVDKIKHLVESVDALQKMFKKKPQRSYASYVKYPLSPRFVRVGGLEEMDAGDDSDPELDMIDSKIPSREEIKLKSERIYAQALLRRGLR